MFHPATYQENHLILGEKPSEIFFHDAILQQQTLSFSHLRNFFPVQTIQQFNRGDPRTINGLIEKFEDPWISDPTDEISDLNLTLSRY